MSRSKRMASSFTANWSRVAAQIRSSRKIVLFLDFDGTLVNIAPRPELVRLVPATRRVLRRLARHPRITVIVISGRRRAELLRHISVRGIRYFGLYGWERHDRLRLPRPERVALRRVRERLSDPRLSVPGIWVEDKVFSLSVHFLAAPPAAKAKVRRRVRTLLRPFRRTLWLMENLRDDEILPRAIQGKGDAVKQFLAKSAGPHALPVYLGDDNSDESAFDAVRGGISIRVGAPRPTGARYSLPGPPAVARALAKLETALI